MTLFCPVPEALGAYLSVTGTMCVVLPRGFRVELPELMKILWLGHFLSFLFHR